MFLLRYEGSLNWFPRPKFTYPGQYLMTPGGGAYQTKEGKPAGLMQKKQKHSEGMRIGAALLQVKSEVWLLQKWWDKQSQERRLQELVKVKYTDNTRNMHGHLGGYRPDLVMEVRTKAKLPSLSQRASGFTKSTEEFSCNDSSQS